MYPTAPQDSVAGNVQASEQTSQGRTQEESKKVAHTAYFKAKALQSESDQAESITDQPVEPPRTIDFEEFESLRKKFAQLESDMQMKDKSMTSEHTSEPKRTAGTGSTGTVAATASQAPRAPESRAVGMPPPPKAPQPGLSYSTALGRPAVKHTLTPAERTSRIRQHLVEFVVPYVQVSKDAWNVVDKFGDEEIWDKCQDSTLELDLPTQPSFENHMHKQGFVRPSEYDSLLIRCRKCAGKHPTDICGRWHQVFSRIFNRDPALYKDFRNIDLDDDRQPCLTCSHDNKKQAAEFHYTMQHDRSGFYEHTQNPPILEILENAEHPEEVLHIIPLVHYWPGHLQRKEPLPIYCFFPDKFVKPTDFPKLQRPLTYGLRDMGRTIPAAVREQMDREAGRLTSRKGTTPKDRTPTPVSSSGQSVGDRSTSAASTTQPTPSGFGDAQVHPKLSSAGVASDGVYLLSATFVEAITPMLIPNHKVKILQFRDYTKHLYDWLTKVYVNDKNLKSALVAKNRLLWNQILKPYAEAWAPGSKSLPAEQHADSGRSYAKLVDLQLPWPNAWTYPRVCEVAPELRGMISSLAPNPTDPDAKPPGMESESKPSASTQVDEGDKTKKQLNPYCFDPHTNDDADFAPAVPTNDDEAKEQLDHFRHRYAQVVLPELQSQFTGAIDLEFNKVREYLKKEDQDTRTAVKEHMAKIKDLGSRCIREHLQYKEEIPASDENAFDNFGAFSKKLEDFWDGYHAELKDLKESLESIQGLQQLFKTPNQKKIWGVLLGRVLPSMHPIVRPLRQMVISKTMADYEEF